MHSVPLFFALLAFIIFVGFAGTLLFERTRIPDVLILIAVGVLLGPAGNLIPPEILRTIAPYFGALALVMILFEGGIELELAKTLSQFAWALLLVVVSFTMSLGLVAGYLWLTGTLDWQAAILLGAIVGCTSGPIIIPLLSGLNISERMKTILSVESALSDALAILVTLLLARSFGTGLSSIHEAVRMLVPSLATGMFIGVLGGIGWLYVLEYIRERRLSYVLSFAALLGLYAFVEAVYGSAALAVLMAGVILGNGELVRKWVGIRPGSSGDSRQVVFSMLRWLHGEVSFIIRTFFFVFLGMLIEFSFFDRPGLLVGFSVFLLVLVSRWITVNALRLTPGNKPRSRRERSALMFMIPRGLACAVLATDPSVVAVTGPTAVLGITFVTIVLTNVYMVFGVALMGRSAPAPVKTKSA